MHRPQLIALAMVLLHPADLADGDDGPRAIRHSRLADLAVAGHSLSVILRHGLDIGKNLPHRHLHVRKETLRARPHPLGTL